MILPVMQPNRRAQKPALAWLAIVVSVAAALASFSSSSSSLSVLGMELFQVKFIELDNSRLIATSNYNYALASPKLLSKGWQTVSVNGDQVQVTLASNGQPQVLSRSQLAPGDLTFVEQLRDEIAASNNGYYHISNTGGYSASSSSSGGGNNIMISSSNIAGGGSSSSSSFQSSASGGTNFNMRDDDNFSVSRSDFPYDWSRVFFNGNTLTFVSKSGEVRMQPMGTLTPDQLAAVNRIKSQVLEMKRAQTQQAARTMQQSMDMVSNVFSNVMNRFPPPPDYQSSVGNMFGSNWPFGPNNSPFSAPGWPFNAGAGGAGAMAFADAGRRRRRR